MIDSDTGASVASSPLTATVIEVQHTPTVEGREEGEALLSFQSPPAPPAPVPAEEAEDPKLSRKFQALSQKEKALRDQEQSLSQQRKEYQAYQESIKEARKNPLNAIKSLGLSMDDVVGYAIDPDHYGAEKPEDLTQKKLAQIEARIKEFDNTAAEYEKKQLESKREDTKKAVVQNISTMVSAEPERFELISLHNVEHEVLELMLKTFESTQGKTQLSLEEAGDILEKQLELESEENLKLAERLKKTRKLQKASQAPAGKSIPAQSFQSSQTIPVSKTLQPTLTQTASPASVQTYSETRAAQEERRKEVMRQAASLIRWTDD